MAMGYKGALLILSTWSRQNGKLEKKKKLLNILIQIYELRHLVSSKHTPNFPTLLHTKTFALKLIFFKKNYLLKLRQKITIVFLFCFS